MSKLSLVAKFALEDFGYHIHAIFGDWPYHVGTSVMSSDWNDVDVRLILDDERYERDGYGDPLHAERNQKWTSTCIALSHFGRVLTGLPIDFQIQQQSCANQLYSQKDGHVRSALGIVRQLRQQ